MPAVTIREVADYAQVSQSTVSRVLNNNPKVNPELRQRVLAAVQALGYQPDRRASQLRTRSSDVIGLVISDIQNPFFLPVVRGVEDTTYAHHKSLLLCNTDEDLAKQAMYLRVMKEERVAGLIICPSNRGEGKLLNDLYQTGIPIVLIDRKVDGYEFDTVWVDNFESAYRAVSHLIHLGHERIGLIGVTLKLAPGKQRHRGYLQALKDAGIAVDEALVHIADSKIQGGYDAARALMALDHPPQALFVANNMMMTGALRALRELGRRIPQDVALVGFDDTPWFSEVSPPITVVAQPTYEIGKEAAQLLLRRLAEPKMSVRTLTLPTELVIRQSCGAVSA